MVATRYYYSPQTSSAPDAGWKIIVSSKFWAKNSTKICAQSFSFRSKGKTQSWHWTALKTRTSPAQWSRKVELVMPTNTVVQYWEVLYCEKVSTLLGLFIQNSDICYWAFRRIQKSVLALDCSSGNSRSKTLVYSHVEPTWETEWLTKSNWGVHFKHCMNFKTLKAKMLDMYLHWICFEHMCWFAPPWKTILLSTAQQIDCLALKL